MRRCAMCLLTAAAVLAARAEPAAEPDAGAHPPAAPALLANGGFDADANGDGWPDGWPHPKGATWETDGTNRFLRLTSPAPGETVLVYLSPGLPPDAKALALSYRVRHRDILRGKRNWFDGRIMMNFKDAAGKVLGSPAPPIFVGTRAEWAARTNRFLVPAGATKLEIMPALFQAAGGVLDLDDFVLAAADPATVPPPPPPPPLIRSETVAPANPAALPPELRVAGNRLETPDGKPVWLQGLSVDSLQWSAAGERITNSIPVAIDEWKANAIRLAVKHDFWFGRGPWQKREKGGTDYRAVVDSAVEAAASRGAYLVLDLHVFGAPAEKHVEFWRDAAVRYRNHPAVLYELFNEPHSLSWKVWRDGGALKSKENAAADANPAENAEKAEGPTTPGMQALVDAVRATGARNPIVAGGLDWGYDLSGVVAGYALAERGGNGIVYSSHIYPWKKDWQRCVLDAAAKHPVFVGEVGCPPDYTKFTFIPEPQRYPLEGWAQDVLALIQEHRLHWTGFSFHPKCGPMVILDWDYTPTPYWGVHVKDALAGKRFELRKMR